ncbi:hypothetical protein [Streptomyces sp. NBC_00102]|uniref:hypothetical protein n=1 Tax=Streptomyces sp. NBC_00102 TaxID=2975652 RepID=UPI00225AF77A|nr:hypothetical protein [Streptomyces sp. NBC_00102]MCX5400058.1 hypothetical protein [Streptomyces sp. NBC_00102]
MHSEPTYEITTLPHPNTSAYGPMVPAELPPGVQLVTLPGGIRTLAYTQHPTGQVPQSTTATAAPIPTWAKTTALLTPTIGGGISAAGIGLSYAAPGLIAMSHALWAAVALIAAAAIGIPVLLRLARAAATSSTGGESTTHITQNITATGLFGKANGTINHH